MNDGTETKENIKVQSSLFVLSAVPRPYAWFQTYHKLAKHSSLSLSLSNLGQAPSNEEKVEDGKDGADDDADEHAAVRIADDAQDGEKCSDDKC